MTTIIKNFRHDINALRAIAVLSVVFFHYKVPFFDGGFSGVDVFFVISGYLMSRIILKGIDKGGFSVLEFYGKRVKRIIPELLIVVFVVLTFCFFFYFPFEYTVNQKNAFSSVLFISNIYYFLKSGYFDPSSDTNLFLHTWSLSAEWQFYLIYPLILMLLKRFIKKQSQFLIFFTITTALFLVGAIAFSTYNPNASFYLLPTRAWEMMFGGLVFLTEGWFRKHANLKWLAIPGYVGIFVSALFFNTEMLWPGPFTIIPVFSTFLVIAANNSEFGLLKSNVVQFLGIVSYSLYLWHWPVFVISQYFAVELTLINTALLIAASIALSYCSYRFVESVSLKVGPILAFTVFMIVITKTLSIVDANRVMFDAKTLKLSSYRKKPDASVPFVGSCFVNTKSSNFNKDRCITIEKGKKNILLLGDSHSWHLSVNFLDFCKKANIHPLLMGGTGCLPILSTKGRVECEKMINFAYKEYLVDNAKDIDGVILSADWVFAVKNKDQLLKNLQATISYLKKLNIKTIIIGQNETYILPYPAIAAKQVKQKTKVDDRYIDIKSFEINDFLLQNLKPYYVNIINEKSFPGLNANGEPYMFDENHFSKYGADLAMEKIIANPIFQEFVK